MSEPKRKYQEAWEKLKKERHLVLLAPAIVHTRIVKALRKEKLMDTAFHLCNDHDHFWIQTVRQDRKDPKFNPQKLEFRLKQRLGFVGVKTVPTTENGL